MNKKTLFSVLVIMTAVCAPALGSAQTVYVQPAAETALAAAVESASVQERQAHELGLSTLYTTWERCDVWVSRSRGTGKRVRVVKPWTCQQVTTACSAVLKEDKAFANISCYYIKQKEGQSVRLRSSRLVQANGEERSLHGVKILKLKDFVVFHLS